MHTDERPFRVLVIEDNRDAADTLAKLLRLLGYEVKAVYSGLDALVAAESFAPDCIVSDIGLPGLDGYALAEKFRLHDSFKRTPLIALTAYTEPERAKAAGFDHHLVKPVNARVIAALISELQTMRQQLEGTKEAQGEVLTEVRGLVQEVRELKQGVAGDIKELKGDLQEEVKELKDELREVKADVKVIKEKLDDAVEDH